MKCIQKAVLGESAKDIAKAQARQKDERRHEKQLPFNLIKVCQKVPLYN